MLEDNAGVNRGLYGRAILSSDADHQFFLQLVGLVAMRFPGSAMRCRHDDHVDHRAGNEVDFRNCVNNSRPKRTLQHSLSGEA